MVGGGGAFTTPVLWFSVTALLSFICLGRVRALTSNAARDVRTYDVLQSMNLQAIPRDFHRTHRWIEKRSLVPEDVTDGSGSSFEESRPKEPTSGVVSRRPKRKVISRGGHYMIRSSSGSSPWSSTSYDGQSTYRTSRPRGYGYNPRGRIGDSGVRITTFGEIIPNRPERRSPRKKIARSFKGEIAQYAMIHGPQKAAMHYEKRVGRRLRERIILKFVQRYKDRVQKSKQKARP